MRADRSSQPAAERAGSPLRVNAPDDALEQEAERAADAFARGAQPYVGVPFSVGSVSLLQRCGCGKKNAGGECDSCRRKRLQRRASPSAGGDGVSGTVAPPVVNEVIGSSGRPLDGETRARMEAHFGADFGSVRVHTDEHAADSAAAVQADAWTVGNHIAFAERAFNPRSTEGQRLLAHELSHVVQQGGGLRRRPAPRGINPTVMDEYDEAKLWAGLKEEYRIKVETGDLDDSDLSNWVIRSRLNGLKSADVTTLIGKVRKHGEQNPKLSVAKVIEYLEVRKDVSTPMPAGATVSRDPLGQGVESYSLTFGRTTVRVMADTFGNTGNDTGPKTNFTSPFSWSAGADGKVNSLTTRVGSTDVPINPTAFEVVIQTRYQGRPDDTSAYGRGTTAQDKEFDSTTLRVHEGSHGSDYILYLQTHPFPVDLSKGVVGVLTADEMRKVQKYIETFFRDAGKMSCDSTDQVGFTQKEYVNTPEGRRSGIVSCK
ncbi:MAG TPA: DUF4157 domain-containing protein [Vicinamibacterales bacterium]|nr:DUF4157 domain-containing protein [Vicinamibacterales bacterium]